MSAAGSPLDVLRDALETLPEMPFSERNPDGDEQARDSMRVVAGEGIAALADVEQLVEAARGVIQHDHIGECGEHPDHLMAAENDIRKLRAALARFDRNQQA
jgi:hypothetical protein